MWGVGCGVWGVGCGVWGVGFRVEGPHVGCELTGTTCTCMKCGTESSSPSDAVMRKRAMPWRNCLMVRDNIPSALTCQSLSVTTHLCRAVLAPRIPVSTCRSECLLIHHVCITTESCEQKRAMPWRNWVGVNESIPVALTCNNVTGLEYLHLKMVEAKARIGP